ncbi:hypothetical protein LU658_27940, partial [Pseudomonas alloputida]|uniref:hypothetical protein n=1 Tax=Pseudomonas alloputida TaxID=1940621 RepID=UPI001E45CD9B
KSEHFAAIDPARLFFSLERTVGYLLFDRSGFTREEALSVAKESEAEHIPRHCLGDANAIHTG